MAAERTRHSARLIALWTNLLVLAAAQFVTLTLLATFLYPGGTTLAPLSHGFEFLDNYISDLGSVHAWSGVSNGGSRVLFDVAVGFLGLAMVVSAPVWGAGFEKRSSWLARAARLSSALGGLCFVGVALTPWDRYFTAHVALVALAFTMMSLLGLTIAVLHVHAGGSTMHALANVGQVALFTAYALYCVVGPSDATHDGLIDQVVAEKVVVYLSVANLAFQAWGVRRLGRETSGRGRIPFGARNG